MPGPRLLCSAGIPYSQAVPLVLPELFRQAPILNLNSCVTLIRLPQSNASHKVEPPPSRIINMPPKLPNNPNRPPSSPNKPPPPQSSPTSEGGSEISANPPTMNPTNPDPYGTVNVNQAFNPGQTSDRQPQPSSSGQTHPTIAGFDQPHGATPYSWLPGGLPARFGNANTTQVQGSSQPQPGQPSQYGPSFSANAPPDQSMFKPNQPFPTLEVFSNPTLAAQPLYSDGPAGRYMRHLNGQPGQQAPTQPYTQPQQMRGASSVTAPPASLVNPTWRQPAAQDILQPASEGRAARRSGTPGLMGAPYSPYPLARTPTPGPEAGLGAGRVLRKEKSRQSIRGPRSDASLRDTANMQAGGGDGLHPSDAARTPVPGSTIGPGPARRGPGLRPSPKQSPILPPLPSPGFMGPSPGATTPQPGRRQSSVNLPPLPLRQAPNSGRMTFSGLDFDPIPSFEWAGLSPNAPEIDPLIMPPPGQLAINNTKQAPNNEKWKQYLLGCAWCGATWTSSGFKDKVSGLRQTPGVKICNNCHSWNYQKRKMKQRD